MSKPIRKYSDTITVSSGGGTATTEDFLTLKNAGGYLEQVLSKAPSGNWTFDFKITDSDGYDVFEKMGARGKINEVPHVPLPAGTYTITISNTKKNDNVTDGDGVYSFKFLLKEIW